MIYLYNVFINQMCLRIYENVKLVFNTRTSFKGQGKTKQTPIAHEAQGRIWDDFLGG